MKNTIQILTLIFGCIIVSCGSGGGDSGGGNGGAPSAAVLIFPLNNSECTTGTSISETQSKVTFEWNVAENADVYFVYVKNLATQNQLQYNANSNTSLEITLTKGIPYSWYVVAKSNADGALTESAKWKFYNAGDGIINYVPFPADVVSPLMSSSVVGPTVNLQWTGSDVDDDIADYKVYFGTTSNPTTLIGTVSTETIEQVAVVAHTTYYWKVVTTDEAGNTSNSPIFQFKTF